jgi:glycosyltransferase involved in cell wall biosynthesis
MARVMNGTVPEVFDRDAAGRALRTADGLDGRFVVTYAGNLGICQGLPHVIEAAAHLKDERPEVLFRFVGSGPVKADLQQQAQGLPNVQFLPRVSLEEAAAHMAAADALLVPLGDHPIYRSFIPSKLFDSMAAARPVLLSVDGEARRVLEEAQAGIHYPAEDGEALARAVREMSDAPEATRAQGQRGRRYARTHCTRAVQADKMGAFLERLAASPAVRVAS